MKLTLLGFSDVSTVVLTEIAADAIGIEPQALKVDVVCNIELLEETIRSVWPLPQSNLSIFHKNQWNPNSKSEILMPGVMSALACQTVVEDFEESCPIRREDFAVIIHPSAAIASSAVIKPGTWIHPNVCVSSMTSIGFCCGINRGASIGHHNLIKDFSRINPGAHLGGSCTVGPGATIGIGAICLEKMKIGPHAFVGGGSVVTKDVLPDSTVVGIPARPIKKE